MIKTIARIDDGGRLAIDADLLQLASLKVGDAVNVEVQAGGGMTITPVTPAVIDAVSAQETARRLIQKNGELFRRLS